MNPYELSWDDIRRALLAFDRPMERSVKLRPPGQPWFHAKPGDDPGDETRNVAVINGETFNTSPGSVQLCPVCGVAWGMDCGRTNCGLNETGQ